MSAGADDDEGRPLGSATSGAGVRAGSVHHLRAREVDLAHSGGAAGWVGRGSGECEERESQRRGRWGERVVALYRCSPRDGLLSYSTTAHSMYLVLSEREGRKREGRKRDEALSRIALAQSLGPLARLLLDYCLVHGVQLLRSRAC